MRRALIIFVGVALLVGCTTKKKPAAAKASIRTDKKLVIVPPEKPSPLSVAPTIEAPTIDARDASPGMALTFRVEVYRVAVPLGTVSRNEPFWKRVNEQAVNVSTYDVLWRNGMRIGVAPLADWDYFADIIKKNPGTVSKMTTLGTEAKQLEMDMKSNLPEQTLMWFDVSNNLRGRSFDRCNNVISLSFAPVPRKTGTLRVAMCPTVRSQRTRLEFTQLNEEREITTVTPESQYDVNVVADVPSDGFLILSPSPEGQSPSSLGRAFLIRDEPAQQMEDVLLVIARPYRLADVK